jgi:hypothetical protein
MRVSAAFLPSGETTGSLPLWILRVGVAACFIGHGMLGVNQTAAWIPYFAVAGVGPAQAWDLMPWVGVFDVAMGLSVLFYPVRAIVAYMLVWAAWTALLRPLAGESFWEAIERAGNYGAPLALYLLFSGDSEKQVWFSRRLRDPRTEASGRTIARVLRLTTGLLLLGHGALNWIVLKPVFSAQYSMLGLPEPTAAPLIGVFECLLALAVLLTPNRWLLLAVVGWKLATEALYPMSGSPFWVLVEHGGSYAAPLALAFLLPNARLLLTASAPAPAR